MSERMAVILRFEGDPEDLIARFERARRSWIEARGDGGSPPAFFAICTANEGVVVVSSWENDGDHRAFRKRVAPHLQAAGVGRPDHHEHLRIAWLGWDPGPAEPS